MACRRLASIALVWAEEPVMHWPVLTIHGAERRFHLLRVKGTQKNFLAISLKKVYTMTMLYKIIRRKIREASTVCRNRDSASARLHVVICAGEPEGEKHL